MLVELNGCSCQLTNFSVVVGVRTFEVFGVSDSLENKQKSKNRDVTHCAAAFRTLAYVSNLRCL